MAVSAFTVANIKPSLNIDSSQRFIFGEIDVPEPLGAFKLDNIFVPVDGMPSRTNLEVRNNMFSGFRWVQITQDGDTHGSYKLQSFVSAEPDGLDILIFADDGSITFAVPPTLEGVVLSGDLDMGYHAIKGLSGIAFRDATVIPDCIIFDNTVQKRGIVFFGGNNDHQFTGIGLTSIPSGFVFQTLNNSVDYYWLQGVSSTSSSQLMKLSSTSGLNVAGNITAVGIFSGNSISVSGGVTAVSITASSVVNTLNVSASGIISGNSFSASTFINFSNSSINRKVILYDTTGNDHQFIGLGTNTSAFRFQVDNVGTDYIWYAASSTTTSVERMRLTSTGLGIGISAPHAPLQFASNYVSRKVVFYEVANNDYQFHGIGISSGATEYVVPSTSSDHVFYAAASSSSKNELARIKGNGDLTVAGNLTVTGSLYSQRSSALMYMQGNATGTTITPASTWTKIAGTTTVALPYLVDFTSPSTNRLTYTGTPTIKANVSVNLTFSHNGAVTEELMFAVYKNGSQVSESIMSTEITTSVITNISLSTIVQLSTNDYIEIWCLSPTNTRIITVKRMTVIAEQSTT